MTTHAPAVRRWHFIYPVAAILALIGLWEGAVRAFDIPRYLLPAPSVIAGVVATEFSGLIADTLITLGEASTGFVIGSSLAFLVGAVFAHFHRIERSFSPLFVALQAVPLVAIAPLLIVWMGNGFLSKVTMAAMVCFFPMVVTTATGLGKVPEEAEELLTVLNATRWQRFIHLRLPFSVPFLLAGLKVNASFAVIGAIVSELAGAGRGIGYQILMASYKTDTPTLFAAIFFASMSGIGFFKTVEAVECRLRKRYG